MRAGKLTAARRLPDGDGIAVKNSITIAASLSSFSTNLARPSPSTGTGEGLGRIVKFY